MLVGGLAAAAVFAVILSIVAVTFDSSGDSTAQHVAFTQAPAGVAASADLTAAEWGTQIQLQVAGLDGDGDIYWLWLSTDDGSRVAAGTFSGDGTMRMSAALPLDKAAHVWVTDKSDAVVLDRAPALTTVAAGADRYPRHGAGEHHPSSPLGRLGRRELRWRGSATTSWCDGSARDRTAVRSLLSHRCVSG